MKRWVPVLIDFEDMTVNEFIDELDKGIDEIPADDSRAWMLFELGHCNVPDSAAVSFCNDRLMELRRALEDLLEEEEENE